MPLKSLSIIIYLFIYLFIISLILDFSHYNYNPTFFILLCCTTGLEIKKILRSPFGNRLEKYSHQMQIFGRQFV